MPADSVHELLDRINALRDPTDLDLLLFFFRHPHVLLTVERVAALVGRDGQRVTVALNGLIDAGLIERITERGLASHIYALRRPVKDALLSLLTIASSRAGRLAVLQALSNRKA